MFGRKNVCVYVPHRDGSIVMIEAVRSIHITPMESKLLEPLLHAEPNPVLNEDLFRVLWPSGVLPDDPMAGLRKYISGLREALNGTPCRIETTLGGYKLVGPMKHERLWSISDE